MVAGLPAGYIMAQVRSIHTQERQPAKPGWTPSALMKDAIADLSDQEIAEAADYFSRGSSAALWGLPDRQVEPWTIYWAPMDATSLHKRVAIRHAWM